jgi:hypothetical protein
MSASCDVGRSHRNVLLGLNSVAVRSDIVVLKWCSPYYQTLLGPSRCLCRIHSRPWSPLQHGQALEVLVEQLGSLERQLHHTVARLELGVVRQHRQRFNHLTETTPRESIGKRPKGPALRSVTLSTRAIADPLSSVKQVIFYT